MPLPLAEEAAVIVARVATAAATHPVRLRRRVVTLAFPIADAGSEPSLSRSFAVIASPLPSVLFSVETSGIWCCCVCCTFRASSCAWARLPDLWATLPFQVQFTEVTRYLGSFGIKFSPIIRQPLMFVSLFLTLFIYFFSVCLLRKYGEEKKAPRMKFYVFEIYFFIFGI